jgi:hypothetical protein
MYKFSSHPSSKVMCNSLQELKFSNFSVTKVSKISAPSVNYLVELRQVFYST